MFDWLTNRKFIKSIRNLFAGNAPSWESPGCTDYRTFIFCRLMRIDDGVVERGLTWPLLFIMTVTVTMETCSFMSIFGPAPLRIRLDCVRSFLLGNLVTSVLFNEYANRRRLDRLHKYLASAMSTLRTDLKEEKEILDKARDEAASNLKMYILIFSSNVAPMVFVPPVAEWLAGRSWRKLPIPWTVPPSDTMIGFALVFSFQFVGVVIANCLGMVFMSFSSITIQLTALFDVLLLSLRHIEDRAQTLSKREGSNVQTALLACLREDIIFYHRLIKQVFGIGKMVFHAVTRHDTYKLTTLINIAFREIREISSATPHLRNTFLAFSATVPMIMACEAFPILAGDVTVGDLIKSAVFLSIQFGCWAQTCIRLETMTDQHGAVFRALYDTPWYQSGVKFKKLVYTTLIYNTQPKYIKARLSNEISATTATFYTFAVSSFNWLNLIRKVD